MIDLYSGGYGAGKGPPRGSLTGARHIQAICHTDAGDIPIDLTDRFDKARSYSAASKDDWFFLLRFLWTGVVDFEKVLPDESRSVAEGSARPDVTIDESVPPALAVGASSGSHAAATPFKRHPTLPKPSEYTGRYSVPSPKSVAPVATKNRVPQQFVVVPDNGRSAAAVLCPAVASASARPTAFCLRAAA